VLLVSVACLWVALEVFAQGNEERALGEVREKISALESRLAAQHRERDAGMRELKRVELEIAAAHVSLDRLREARETQLERQAALGEEMRAANDRLDAERGALAEQMRQSYMSGRQEVVRLLLNQEHPAAVGRMLTYLEYFNRARSRRIAAVNEELATLGTLHAESERVDAELEALEDAQAAELAALAATREERQRIVARAEASIAEAGGEMERLREEEARLTELIAELEALLQELPAASGEPFADRKDMLAWPVEGRIAEDFGRPRAGGSMTWTGVLLEAPYGAPVRAVYGGRVAYADWLPGLGLLIIVDHGDGYMSLYGHNEALLKESGDWVEPGEEIARSGDSGGRATSGVYFEIRRNGQPVDPHAWIKER
jgi:septal ring factor EnvC (AmiA/AmiB activator)